MYLSCVLKAPVDRYCRPEQKCGINKNEKKGNFEETSGMDKSQSGQTILFASALQSNTHTSVSLKWQRHVTKSKILK